MKMDFSGFKKITSDGDKTTFRRKDGHEVHVAHKSLSKKMKAELDKLPCYKGGGDVELEDQIEADELADARITQNKEEGFNPGHTEIPTVGQEVAQAIGDTHAGQEGDAALEAELEEEDIAGKTPTPQAAPQPQGLAPQPAPVSDNRPMRGQEPATATPALDTKTGDVANPTQFGNLPTHDVASPASRQLNVLGETPSSGQQVLNKSQKWRDDLLNGHIEPKTYHDLWAKNSDGSDRGTMAKIGSLFGLLISGAGSGLAHQENMVMKMMDNEINRDLEAQKTSKANAHNLYNLIQQHEKSNAEINSMNAQTNIAINGQAKMMADWKAFAGLKKMVDALPEGSQAKINGTNRLAMLLPQLQEQHGLMAQQIDAQEALLKSMGGGQGGLYSGAQGEDESQFVNRMAVLRQSGQNGAKKADELETKHFSGINQTANRPIEQADRDKFLKHQVLDDKVRDVLDFVKQHTNPKDLLNPQIRSQAIQKAHELTLFYNQTVDSLGLTPGRMEWLEKQIKENPLNVIGQVMGNNARLREIQTSNAGRRDLMLRNYGLPGLSSKTPAAKSGAAQKADSIPDGETGTMKDGTKVIRKNGVWVKK